MTSQLLLPASRIYGLATGVRNWLYEKGLYKVYRPDICVVSVGNLTVGGTGKTPVVEYLIKRYTTGLETASYEIATLSRGYGRRTNGFRVATNQDTAATIGDEPLQLYRKFGQWVRVCVGERRADAIRRIQQDYPDTKRILLDDAFQHRAVWPHINLLLTDYHRPFYDDYPFPAGRLRENRQGASRADAVIVTKCPQTLTTDEQVRIQNRIRLYARPDAPIFFAGLRYGQPVAFATNQPAADIRYVMLVSGLANADPLERYVAQTFSMQAHRRFPDHYAYTRADLDRLYRNLPPGTGLLTTEKDWVKLDALLTTDERAQWPFYYLPVEVQFLADHEAGFTQFLAAILRKNC